MKLSEEKVNLILDNEGLVHHLVQKKVGVKFTSSEYEDFVSVGTVGLTKAASTFDFSKGYRFATYASRCILNEIYMYCRKNNKYIKNISLDEIIAEDGAGGELTLEQKLEDNNSNFVDKILLTEEFINVINIVLNCLKRKHRLVILYKLGGSKRKNIAERINISRTYVAKIERKAISKIREIVDMNQQYKEVFSMEIIEDEYKITFSTKAVEKFNEILARLLSKMKFTEDLPDFKIIQNKDIISILVPADVTSFNFIAQIIQEIDEYSIAYNSDKVKLCEEESKLGRRGKINSTKSTISKIHNKDSTFKETKKASTDEGIIDKLSEESKELIKYMLTKESFTIKEFVEQFPDTPNATIVNVLFHAKEAGIIILESQGKYKVNKT